MTLSARNFIFKAGIILSLLCLVICIIASVQVIPVYPSMETEITHRTGGVFSAFFANFLDASLLAVNSSILALIVYAILTIILVFYYFEKTQSPEILFVIFFVVSFSPETLRLILPLSQVYEIPSLYALMASKIILFCRSFGIFSLFIASVFAVGFESQQQRNFIMYISVSALVIALGIPIDTQTWDSSLGMISGYVPMVRLIEIGVFLITAVGFFIAAWTRVSRGFIFIGSGYIIAYLGRIILLNADAWVSLLIGFALLAAGTWFICTNLHKIYLWL